MSTVWPVVARRVTRPPWNRRRLTLPDDDFVDVDEWLTGGDRAVVLFHGLEGSSESGYIKGMAHAFYAGGWSAVAMNYRGCSGEPNRALRSYHCGATDDVAHVVADVCARFDVVVLVGFSLGGNLVLKFLGEAPAVVPTSVRGAVTFSTPVDLPSSSACLSEPQNRVYALRFLRKLKRKTREKARRYPDRIDVGRLAGIRTIAAFDDAFTAPLHGFRDAADYYARSSARPFLDAIDRPTLVVNALDDPLLGPECYPDPAGHPNLVIETPRHGGHVGFVRLGRPYWSEVRAVSFAQQV